ncbi:MAG: polyprenyl synthetase family protein [Fimbriimonadaceae bacterium]|nr:polyprenyl synthetase family protein [Fimbriimonadaceae bacterium]
MDAETLLWSYRDLTDRRLNELLPPATQSPVELHEAMRYSGAAPGKRLRPALCMACCEAVGGKPEDAVDAGCAIELVHAFSLIHDDLPAIDDDELRRGRPTCHVQFGDAIAILAGDALFSLAFEVLSHCPGEPSRVLRSLQVLGSASGSSGLVGGEVLDVLSEGQPATAELIERIHRQKTGALIAASCAIGAILGGGSDSQVSALENFGQRIGLAFQMADDILNETSTPEKLGKSAGSDRERQKATYPAVYGLSETREKACQLVEQAVNNLPAGIDEAGHLHSLAWYAVNRLS